MANDDVNAQAQCPPDRVCLGERAKLVAIGPRLQRVIASRHRRVQHEATPVSSCSKRMKFVLTWATLLWFALKQVFEFKGVYYAWMVLSGDICSHCFGFPDRCIFSR